MIKLGSCFSGIGGFELGLEKSIPNIKTVWQVEQNLFCQTILAKHWPDSTIHNDVRTVGVHNLEPVDILCGGFPCQDISIAGKGAGINGKRSGLWWEFHRIISELRPRIIVLENVPAITTRGGRDVVGSLSEIGYDCEWTVISAQQCGAPHLRKRWFCVAYPKGIANKRWTAANTNQNRERTANAIQSGRTATNAHVAEGVANTNSQHVKEQSWNTESVEQTRLLERRTSKNKRLHEENYWNKTQTPSAFCRVDDGISNRVDRIRALGNAIVPQCSQWVGEQILNSGLLDDLLETT